jgi:dTDP-4-dehydrorhamnose reductase
MKLLLIGATGQLGGDLLRNNTKHEIHAPGRDELDLARPDQVAAVVRRQKPDVILNCAAFHNVPLCEEQPDQAFLINCVAVRNLAALSAEVGAWFVTFSSDYVFGGNGKRTPYLEDDRPAPLQIYGITRLAGEHAALAVAPRYSIVIRTCGLYGQSGARSKGGNFVDARVADASSGRHIEMACEQIVAPTSTDDLSRAVLQLIEHPKLAPGIYHLVNEGSCSWYQFACAIVEILGAATLVTPVDRGGRSGNMRRPFYSILANDKARHMGIVLPHWRSALEAYLQSKHSALNGEP